MLYMQYLDSALQKSQENNSTNIKVYSFKEVQKVAFNSQMLIFPQICY